MLMRALSLYAMVPEASFDGTALAEGAIPHSKVTQCIKEAMEPSWDDMGTPPLFHLPGTGTSSDAAGTKAMSSS